MNKVKIVLDAHGGVDAVSVTVEGQSNMSSGHDDLKFKAIKAMLETVDEKNYENPERYYEELAEVKKLVDSLSTI